MTCRGLLISAAILTIPTALGGCALPIAVSVASYAFDAFSYAVEGKSVSDLAISNVMGEDCSMLRVVGGNAVCRDYSPEDQRARDRFVAEANTFDRRANRVREPTGPYEPAHEADPSGAAQLAADGRTDGSTAAAADPGVERAVASSDRRDAAATLPLPVAGIGAENTPASEPIEIAVGSTMDGSAAVAMFATDEVPRQTALPPSARTLPAAANIAAIALQTKPTQVASAVGIDAAPKSNPSERPPLAPRLGLDLDTMLLKELAD